MMRMVQMCCVLVCNYCIIGREVQSHDQEIVSN